MARRQMAERQFTQVAMPQNSMAGAMATIAGSADNLSRLFQANAKADAEMKLAEAKIRIDDLTKEYQLRNELNPTQNYEKFKLDRQKILDEYGKSISPFARKDWLRKSQIMTKQNDSTQGGWALQQTYKNTINAVNTGMKSALMTAHSNGEDYALGKVGSYEELTTNFNNSYNEIMDLGSEFLGEARTAEELKKFRSDYAKSVVSGAITVNPDKGLELLNNEGMKNDINDSYAIESLRSFAAQRKKAIDLDIKIANTEAGQKLGYFLLQDKSLTYSQRMTVIGDFMSASEDNVEEGLAAIKFLNSTKRIGVVEGDVKSFGEAVLSMTADAKRFYGTDESGEFASTDLAKEYLKTVQQIRQGIYESGAEGKLSDKEVAVLLKGLTKETRKYVSEATEMVAAEGPINETDIRLAGSLAGGGLAAARMLKNVFAGNTARSFARANEIFIDTVPSSHRMHAIRELFYATDEKEMSEKDFMNEVYNIADKYADEAMIEAVMNTKESKNLFDKTPLGAIVNAFKGNK
jgi:hypothetical protein